MENCYNFSFNINLPGWPSPTDSEVNKKVVSESFFVLFSIFSLCLELNAVVGEVRE